MQPTRLSTRIDRSKNILEKAHKLKKINNLEIPRMKGIMTSNPFNVLQHYDLDNMASEVGVSINISDDNASVSSAYSYPFVVSFSDKEQQE
jgi:hypothetical protein